MNFVLMNPPIISPNLLLVCSPQFCFGIKCIKNANITIYFHGKSHLILWKHLMGSQRLFGWSFLSHILSHYHNPRWAESAWDIPYLGKFAIFSAETAQARKLYKGGNYLQKYSISLDFTIKLLDKKSKKLIGKFWNWKKVIIGRLGHGWLFFSPIYSHILRDHSQTTLTRFWLFLTTYPSVMTSSIVWTLTKSAHFWTIYLPRLVNVVRKRLYWIDKFDDLIQIYLHFPSLETVIYQILLKFTTSWVAS